MELEKRLLLKEARLISQLKNVRAAIKKHRALKKQLEIIFKPYKKREPSLDKT
jgi:hypothetical protein